MTISGNLRFTAAELEKNLAEVGFSYPNDQQNRAKVGAVKSFCPRTGEQSEVSAYDFLYMQRSTKADSVARNSIVPIAGRKGSGKKSFEGDPAIAGRLLG
jgi:hypothetical protein